VCEQLCECDCENSAIYYISVSGTGDCLMIDETVMMNVMMNDCRFVTNKQIGHRYENSNVKCTHHHHHRNSSEEVDEISSFPAPSFAAIAFG